MARVRLATVVCAGIALAGCGAQTQPASQPPTPTQAVSGAPSAPMPPPAVVVPERLRFTAKTVDGKDFTGESLAGMPAVLWFWAPWCPKCRGEAEDIAAAAKETSGSVRFLGVAAQDTVPAMRKFVEDYGVGSFPHLADTDLAVWKRFGVIEQPAYAFVKADGTVEMVTRQLPTNDLRERVRALAG